MKYYLVYLLNYKENDTVTLKDSYQAKEDALKSLERNAVEYIKELQGKQQADVCKQEKTPKEILKDVTLKEGMYYIVEGDAVILYEKVTVIQPGTIWGNSSTLKINKIGKFYITEYNFDDSIFRCTCMLTKANTTTPKYSKPSISLSFIDELKNKNGDFGLKPPRKRSRTQSNKKLSPMAELCYEIDNYLIPVSSGHIKID